jgi:hypothetical protein
VIISEFRKLADWNNQPLEVRTNILIAGESLKARAERLSDRLEVARGAGDLGWLGIFSVVADEIGESFSEIDPKAFCNQLLPNQIESAVKQFIVSQYMNIAKRFIHKQLEFKGQHNEAA